MESIRPVKVPKTENDDQSDSREGESVSEEAVESSVTSDYSWNEPCSSESMSAPAASVLRGTIKELIKQRRVWWFTEHGAKYINKRHDGLDFTVMSYNILSQKLLEDHPYLYSHCKPEHLSWNFRSKNLLREITECSADILCLQEVEEDHYRDVFLPHLQNYGYSSLYKKKTRGKCDGCAIFFRDQKFSLEAHADVEYRRNDVEILNRDNVGLIALLKPKVSTLDNVKLCVATTHLLFNPKRGDVKLSQLRILFAEIEKLAFKSFVNNVPIYHPILLCGDMNSEPFSPLYNFIVNGNIEYDKMMSVEVSGQRKFFNQGPPMSSDALSLQALDINFETRYDNNSSPSFPFYQRVQHLAMRRKLSNTAAQAQHKIAKDVQNATVDTITIAPAASSTIGTSEAVTSVVTTEATAVDTQPMVTTAAATTAIINRAAVVAAATSKHGVTAMEVDAPDTIKVENVMEVDVPDSNTEVNAMEVDAPVIPEAPIAIASECVVANSTDSTAANTSEASATDIIEISVADTDEASAKITEACAADTSESSAADIAKTSPADITEAPAHITEVSAADITEAPAADTTEASVADTTEASANTTEACAADTTEASAAGITEAAANFTDDTSANTAENTSVNTSENTLVNTTKGSLINTAGDSATSITKDTVTNPTEVYTSKATNEGAPTTTSTDENVFYDVKTVQPSKSIALPDPSSDTFELECRTTGSGYDQDICSDGKIAPLKVVMHTSVDQDVCHEKLIQPKSAVVPEMFNTSELAFNGSVTATATTSNDRDMSSDVKTAKPRLLFSPRISSTSRVKDKQDSVPLLQSNIPDSSNQNEDSGSFIHHLNLVSAYKHIRPDGRKEITTQNENSICTVDYIFYSVNNKENFKFSTRHYHKRQVEGSLKHLGCYGLLHNPDFKDLCGLPNAYLSSDHICLISRFCLST